MQLFEEEKVKEDVQLRKSIKKLNCNNAANVEMKATTQFYTQKKR